METRQKILVVEDEEDIAHSIMDGLSREGFIVTIASDGQTAVRHLTNSNWDLVVLDLMLPGLGGEAILSYLTNRSDYPPTLILSAKTQLEGKVALFRSGCDDYLTKPFMFEELLARIQALLRRPARTRASEYRYEDVKLNPQENQLLRGKTAVVLTPKETALCRLLIQDPERVVSRKELLQGVWGLKEEPSANYIGIHLFKLRKKLEQLMLDEWLQTVRASGYRFCNPEKQMHGN